MKNPTWRLFLSFKKNMNECDFSLILGPMFSNPNGTMNRGLDQLNNRSRPARKPKPDEPNKNG